MVYRREEILSVNSSIGEVHSILSKVPQNITLNEINQIISISLNYFRDFPPDFVIKSANLNQIIPKDSSWLSYPYPWMKSKIDEKKTSLPIVKQYPFFLNRKIILYSGVALLSGLLVFYIFKNDSDYKN